MKIYKVRDLDGYRDFVEKTKAEYERHLEFLQSTLPWRDKKFFVRGYSYTAGKQVKFRCDFKFSTGFPEVNWRERVICPVTRLNNRSRASIHIIDLLSNAYPADHMYVMEQTTALYRFLKEKYINLVGSEFLGQSVPLGTNDSRGIRNEDATKLTFADNSLNTILSFDVFEHIFDYKSAFKECYRVLKRNGCMIFSVPFDVSLSENRERAIVLDNGEISHLLPPEYHGDPLSKDGILCFRHYGWNMLQDLHDVGFNDTFACVFNSKEMGYFTNQMIFYCNK